MKLNPRMVAVALSAAAAMVILPVADGFAAPPVKQAPVKPIAALKPGLKPLPAKPGLKPLPGKPGATGKPPVKTTAKPLPKSALLAALKKPGAGGAAKPPVKRP